MKNKQFSRIRRHKPHWPLVGEDLAQHHFSLRLHVTLLMAWAVNFGPVRGEMGKGGSGVMGPLTEMNILCVLIIDNNYANLGECIAQCMEGHILETKLITFHVMLSETRLLTNYYLYYTFIHAKTDHLALRASSCLLGQLGRLGNSNMDLIDQTH